VGCEFSGVVRDAFRARGHDAWSCDLLPSERPGPHIQGDVLDVLSDGWDLMIAHPPCQYLSRAGARWRTPERMLLAQEALAFVLALWDAPIAGVAIENPIGMLNRLWRYPDQTIEPWHFGERFTKRTCLWLRGVPPLMATEIRLGATPLLPSNVGWGRRNGQRSHPGHTHSARDASRTLGGVANAMADQWGSLPVQALGVTA
jgi:hypothetical protein